MLRTSIFHMIALLVAVSMACSVRFDLPVDEITTAQTMTELININPPEGTADVNLTFGAGELRISPGIQGTLISGTAKYNVQHLKPVVEIEDERVKLSTGNFEIKGIPDFNEALENTWELTFSDSPMELEINAGAYKGSYDFGGMAITSLDITDGASDVQLEFSQPNKVEMEHLRYVTGASTLELSGLANANFKSMIFRGGAGNFILDFSGMLLKDTMVQIESGLSHVVVIVPETTAARVIFRGGLTTINASSEWDKSDNEYNLKGSGPTLTIYVDMAAGDFDLQSE